MSSPDSLHTAKFNSLSNSMYELPKTPNPSLDTGLAAPPSSSQTDISPPCPTGLDIFTLSPVVALGLLCVGVEALVRVTGDVPPAPPPSHPTTPNMRSIQAEKENIVRSHSYTSLNLHQGSQSPSGLAGGPEDIDGVKLRKTPLDNSDIGPKEPYIIIGANAEPLNLQHSAITRKFYSKQSPPISLEDYLMRIHKFCPMSTGVYLATSVYIHRLAVEERAIPVTRRNSHRLLLAGLRVAMKALEDHSYSHKLFSKVGGVSKSELARLEISFCFLTNFELRVTKEVLLKQALSLKEIGAAQAVVGGYGLSLRLPLKTKGKRRVNVPMQETMLEVTADA
jgi:Cyclin